MFGSTNKSRLQQQRMRQRTNLAAMQVDDDDDDGEAASNVGNNKSTKSKSIAVKPSTTKSNTTGISFAERATNDDDDEDDNGRAATAATSTVPIKRMVAAVPLSSFVVEDSGGSAAAAARYTDDDLNALRAQTRTVPTAPRRTDGDTGAIGDGIDVDDDVTVAGLPPPTSVRILSDEEIARAKQLKAEARNASAFVALDPRRQPDAPQDDDLMAERIALTVASLQRTASSTDLDHDAEIARWELRNVHAGGGGAQAIGNALRQAAGGKPSAAGSGAANRRPTTDIGAIDALVATDCDSKCSFVCFCFFFLKWFKMRAVRVRFSLNSLRYGPKMLTLCFALVLVLV